MRLDAAVLGALLVIGGCGEPGAPVEGDSDAAGERATVFDPLVGTLERAGGVQETLDQRAAEQRRRLEEAERGRE